MSRIIRVAVGPGHRQFTLISGAHSIAADWERPTTACLEATYPARFGTPRTPACDAVLRIAPPPRSRIAGITLRSPRNTPRRLIAIVRSNASIG